MEKPEIIVEQTGSISCHLKLSALQTEERPMSRCCWFINTTRKLLMASALFVLANYKGAKSSELTAVMILKNLLPALTQSWCAVGAAANSGSSFLAGHVMCHSFRSQRSAQPPYSSAYCSIVYLQCSHRASPRSLGQIYHKHWLVGRFCGLRTVAFYQVDRHNIMLHHGRRGILISGSFPILEGKTGRITWPLMHKFLMTSFPRL